MPTLRHLSATCLLAAALAVVAASPLTAVVAADGLGVARDGDHRQAAALGHVPDAVLFAPADEAAAQESGSAPGPDAPDCRALADLLRAQLDAAPAHPARPVPLPARSLYDLRCRLTV